MTPEQPESCGYEAPFFGATYPDGICIEGYMWDLDSCDEPGGALHFGGDIACPRCNAAAFLEWAMEDAEGTVEWSFTTSAGHVSGTGADIWESAKRRVLEANPAEANKLIAPFNDRAIALAEQEAK